MTVVDLWRIELGPAGQPSLQRHRERLSAQERARADKFRYPRDEYRFIVRRSILRAVLGTRLGVEPAKLCFESSGNGKPRIVGISGVHFNASSSGDSALVACSTSELGVDLEVVQPANADDGVARRFFSGAEVAALATYGPSDGAAWAEAFFRCWTRKEAYVKGIGLGLSLELDSFDVQIEDVAEPLLVRSEHRPYDVARWRLADLGAIFHNHRAALACDSPGLRPQVNVHPYIEQ